MMGSRVRYPSRLVTRGFAVAYQFDTRGAANAVCDFRNGQPCDPSNATSGERTPGRPTGS